MRMSYFLESPRGFANELNIAIACSRGHAQAYRDAQWQRISREEAIRYLAKPANCDNTDWYVGAEIDGREPRMGRRELARAIRVGDDLH
jgi:hypothetical protein